MNRCEPRVCQPTSSHQATVKAIVHWKNKEGTQSHCLARIYKSPEQMIVLASEIRSNFRDHYWHPGIGLRFADIANALFDCFPDFFHAVEPDQILWISHYGSFSHYDSVSTENFTRNHLRFQGGKFENDSLSDHQRLSNKEAQVLLGHLEIENIYDVLREIGWQKHNE